MSGPSHEFMERAYEAEERCPSFSVGGLAADTGMLESDQNAAIRLVNLTALISATSPPAIPPLRDAQGEIPKFAPLPMDEHGRMLPMSDEERKARWDALTRTLNEIDRRADGEGAS